MHTFCKIIVVVLQVVDCGFYDPQESYGDDRKYKVALGAAGVTAAISAAVILKSLKSPKSPQAETTYTPASCDSASLRIEKSLEVLRYCTTLRAARMRERRRRPRDQWLSDTRRGATMSTLGNVGGTIGGNLKQGALTRKTARLVYDYGLEQKETASRNEKRARKDLSFPSVQTSRSRTMQTSHAGNRQLDFSRRSDQERLVPALGELGKQTAPTEITLNQGERTLGEKARVAHAYQLNQRRAHIGMPARGSMDQTSQQVQNTQLNSVVPQAANAAGQETVVDLGKYDMIVSVDGAGTEAPTAQPVTPVNPKKPNWLKRIFAR